MIWQKPACPDKKQSMEKKRRKCPGKKWSINKVNDALLKIAHALFIIIIN